MVAGLNRSVAHSITALKLGDICKNIFGSALTHAACRCGMLPWALSTPSPKTGGGSTLFAQAARPIRRTPGQTPACYRCDSTRHGMALALGSYWALVPASVASGILLLRAQWEDQTLQAEVDGYREYTHCVPYKLIRHVW